MRRTTLRQRGAVGVLAFAVCVAGPGGLAESPPLPDREQFLKEVGARLRTDRSILRQYSYTRTVEERDRDGSGRVTARRRHVYEVWPLPDDPEGFRITLVKDSKARSTEDIANERAEYRQRLGRFERERAQESPADRERRERREAEARREAERILADVRGVFEVELVRRETVNGVPSIFLTFRPRADARPRTDEGRLLTKVAGQAWFSEADYELVRVEATAIEPIRYGWGILARINTGARAVVERRRYEGEWVPARYDFSASGRLLVVKGLNREATVWFTNLHRIRPR